jgi:phage/plasmid-like protein (TIGR03299 family)
VPNSIVNVRTDTKEVLGTVTGRYKVVQNADAFSFIAGVLGKKTGMKFIETAGTLHGGRVVFILGRMEGVSVLGDQVDPYLIFQNSHDGSSIVKACVTPTRVVCWNTLTAAIQGAKRCWGTPHTGDIDQKLLEAQETIRNAHEYMKAYPEFAKTMVDIGIYGDDIPGLMDKFFPIPEEASPRTLKTIEWKKACLFHLYKETESTAKFEGTGWGVYNAVSDFMSHVKPASERNSWQENTFENCINGHPLLQIAQREIMALPEARKVARA